MFPYRKFYDDDVAGSGGFHVDQLPVVERASNHHLLRTNDAWRTLLRKIKQKCQFLLSVVCYQCNWGPCHKLVLRKSFLIFNLPFIIYNLSSFPSVIFMIACTVEALGPRETENIIVTYITRVHKMELINDWILKII